MFLDSNLGFLVKVLGLSALMSVAIKALGPLLPLPSTTQVAIPMVLTPTVVMALVLFVRAKAQS